MERGLTNFWRNYRHRFVPWMANNIRSSAKRRVLASSDKISSDEDVLHTILKISSSLNQELKRRSINDNKEVMLKALGFCVKRSKSCLKNAGQGVVMSAGSADKGDFIAFYPGTLYRRFEPLFLPSIGNKFILRCMDGIHIDGNDRLLSKAIYNSCVSRDSFGNYQAADLSWITKTSVVPWNVGQYVNNGTKEYCANVAYQELDIDEFPPELDYLLPNIWYSGSRGRHRRAVALIATRKIQAGDEILSNYVTFVHNS